MPDASSLSSGTYIPAPAGLKAFYRAPNGYTYWRQVVAIDIAGRALIMGGDGRLQVATDRITGAADDFFIAVIDEPTTVIPAAPGWEVQWSKDRCTTSTPVVGWIVGGMDTSGHAAVCAAAGDVHGQSVEVVNLTDDEERTDGHRLRLLHRDA